MIAIVGGGPAGCSAGIFLAKNGFKNIRIYEKNLNKRKVCGGGLSWKVLERYKEFIKDINKYPVKECTFDFDRKVFKFSFKRKIGAIVDRLEFDKNMRHLAESYGIKIINKNIELNKIKSKFIINASGFRRSRELFLCMQSFVKMKNPEFSVIFRKNLNPVGYSWIFPLFENYANIGTGGLIKTFKLPITKAFDKFAKEFKINASKKYVSPIGIHSDFNPLTQTLKKRTVLNVGEAANLVNPLTGEGIYYALRSGEIVANSLSEKTSVESYKRAIKDEFGKEFLLCKVLRKILMISPSIIERNIFLILLKLLNCRIQVD
jgi:flavin-dependent dehydrogenase